MERINHSAHRGVDAGAGAGADARTLGGLVKRRLTSTPALALAWLLQGLGRSDRGSPSASSTHQSGSTTAFGLAVTATPTPVPAWMGGSHGGGQADGRSLLATRNTFTL